VTRSLLMAGRTRYAMPLSPSLRAKFDALAEELDVHVLGSRGAVEGALDARFTLVAPIRPRWLDGAAFYALFPWRVARALRRDRPDAVLVQGAQETALALVGRALARVPAQIVADVHGDPAAATRLYGSPLRRTLSLPGDALARRAIRRADGVRTISTYTSRLVSDLGVEPTAEFPAFMDLEPFETDRPAPFPARPTVLFVGVLERYKAVDVLADAWRIVAGRVPDAELRLVGRGTMANVPRALVAELPDSVRWDQALPTRDVARALDAATVLVLPSRSEGLGRVVVEAFCRGRGVVGSRVGGIPDIVEDGVSGLLVPPGDAGALAAALERVLLEPGLASSLGAAAHACVGPWLATPAEYARRVRALVDVVCAPAGESGGVR
jgi:glycogen(starch) synthase